MKKQCICSTPLQALLVARSAEPALLEAAIARTFGRSLADGTLVLDSVVYSLADLLAKCEFIIYCRRCDTHAFFRQAAELQRRVKSGGLCRRFPGGSSVRFNRIEVPEMRIDEAGIFIRGTAEIDLGKSAFSGHDRPAGSPRPVDPVMLKKQIEEEMTGGSFRPVRIEIIPDSEIVFRGVAGNGSEVEVALTLPR